MEVKILKGSQQDLIKFILESFKNPKKNFTTHWHYKDLESS